MKKYLLYLLLCTLTSLSIAEAAIKQVNLPNSQNGIKAYSMLRVSSSSLYCFYIAGDSLLLAYSTDSGISWLNDVKVLDNKVNLIWRKPEITSLITAQGKIVIAYLDDDILQYGQVGCITMFSEDTGITWVTTKINGSNDYIGISLYSADAVHLLFTKLNLGNNVYGRKNSYGTSWSSEGLLFNGAKNGSVIKVDFFSSYLLLVVENNGIQYSISTNGGSTWGPLQTTSLNDLNISRPHIMIDHAGVIWVYYELIQPTIFNGIQQTDIYYSSSTTAGLTWAPPSRLTSYKGPDRNISLVLTNNSHCVYFMSNRGNKYFQDMLWQATPGEADTTTLPYIAKLDYSHQQPLPREQLKIKAYIDSPKEIISVLLTRKLNNQVMNPVKMLDNGQQGDSAANDHVFTYTQTGLFGGDTLDGVISVRNSDKMTFIYSLKGIKVAGLYGYRMNVNRLKLPFSNNGIVADVDLKDYASGGLYDGNRLIFSGGFFLSGYSGNFMWSNGVVSSARIQDYQKGNVGSSVNDPINIIYEVAHNDLPFSESWIRWKDAVSLGADYYDGNKNGIYDPSDLNHNGRWDSNEDKPDILGDLTTWCVYNDGVPSNLRRFGDVTPQGIEIHQTTFALKDSSDYLNNFVFFRYRLINKGTTERMDSVYFGIFSDPDIGDYTDDLIGCDTLLNAAFGYNDGDDNTFGSAPPAFFNTLLQGPVSYIPGATYIDHNDNNIYDEGVDADLDSAYSYTGPNLGIKLHRGAKKLEPNSFMRMHTPDHHFEWMTKYWARNSLQGLVGYEQGVEIDPCTWTLGGVFGGVNCVDLNKRLWYSGDPVERTGWINTTPFDQIMLLNTGPFQLFKNKPVDIIVGYSAARGSSALNSITVGRNGVRSAIQYYRNNFPASKEPLQWLIPENYSLLQNYPNPFNPATNIIYSIPVTSSVKLTIYNILGERVSELVNTIQPEGYYNVSFNGVGLASGVYFYYLTAASTDNQYKYNSVKKMLLIK